MDSSRRWRRIPKPFAGVRSRTAFVAHTRSRSVVHPVDTRAVAKSLAAMPALISRLENCRPDKKCLKNRLYPVWPNALERGRRRVPARVSNDSAAETIWTEKSARDAMSPDTNEEKSPSIGHGSSTIIHSQKTSQTNDLNSSSLKC